MIEAILDISNQLSAIQRYSKTKLTNPESVLEHQGFVSLACYIITARLNQYDEKFDLGKVLMSATIHDIDEIGTGDVQRPTKYSSDMMLRMLNDLAFKSASETGNRIGIDYFDQLWDDAKSGREGRIVALCDGLAVLYKVWQEVVLFGNISIIDHIGPLGVMLDKKYAAMLAECQTELGINLISELRVESFLILHRIETKAHHYGS